MAKRELITPRVCDQVAQQRIGSARQREIATLAFKFWLAREFKNGSPQEDWLRAQGAVQQSRQRA